MASERLVGFILAGLTAGALSGCGNQETAALESIGSTESKLVGGDDAVGHEYDPIGALVYVKDDGSLVPFCTGTLTAPNVVTTAKHCMLGSPTTEQMAFAIGLDAREPDILIPIVAKAWERDVTEGRMGFGSDVAVTILERPVEGVRPAFIWPVHESEIGKEVLAVGYGMQDFPWSDPQAEKGTRKKGTMELAAVGGMSVWKAFYDNDFTQYFADYVALLPPDQANAPETLEAAKAEWEDDRLTEQYDAVLHRVTAGPSGGDSGGPVLTRLFGHWIVRATVTGGTMLWGDTDYTVGSNYAIYSTFGPEAAYLVLSAPICQGIPEEGQCDGTSVQRCSRLGEGFPRVIEEECAETCVDAPGGARCAPKCAQDPDCDATQPNGVCVDGVCEWSVLDHCAAEPGRSACFLCCMGMGQESYDACVSFCYDTDPTQEVSAAFATLPAFPDLRIPIPAR